MTKKKEKGNATPVAEETQTSKSSEETVTTEESITKEELAAEVATPAPDPEPKEAEKKDPNVGSRKVFLRRRPLVGHLPKEILADAKSVMGSVFKNRQPIKAFEDLEEEKRFLGPVLDVDPEDREWGRYVRKFYAELRIKVGFEGKPLEIGLYPNGDPISLMDYITYRFAKAHPMCADSESEMNADQGKRWYIQDPNKDVKKKNNLVQMSKAADVEFIKIAEDPTKMRNILRVTSNIPNLHKLDNERVENLLYDIKQAEPAKFVKAAKDPDVHIEAEILDMIESNTLVRIGNAIYFYDEHIGDNTKEAILFFKNPKRSTSVNRMKLKHREMIA